MNKGSIKPVLIVTGILAALALALLPPLLLRIPMLWFITPAIALVAIAGVFFKRAWLLTLAATLEMVVIVFSLTKAFPALSDIERSKLYATGQIVKADIYYGRADYSKAMEAYRQSEVAWIIDPWLDYQRARCYNYTGQNQTAFELFVSLEKFPYDVPPEMLETDMALAAIKSYHFDDGEAIFTECINQNFRPGYSYFQLGIYYRINGQTEQAEQALSKAHKLGYERSDCSSILGEIAEGRKNYDLAEKLYRRGLHESFENLIIYAKLGSLLHRMGRTDEATTILLDGFNLSAMVPYNPRSSAMILNNLGYIYGDQRKTGQAIMAFKQAIHMDQSFMEPYYNLTYIYMLQGRTSEALEVLQAILAKDPNDGTARRMISEILAPEMPESTSR